LFLFVIFRIVSLAVVPPIGWTRIRPQSVVCCADPDRMNVCQSIQPIRRYKQTTENNEQEEEEEEKEEE